MEEARKEESTFELVNRITGRAVVTVLRNNADEG